MLSKNNITTLPIADEPLFDVVGYFEPYLLVNVLPSKSFAINMSVHPPAVISGKDCNYLALTNNSLVVDERQPDKPHCVKIINCSSDKQKIADSILAKVGNQDIPLLAAGFIGQRVILFPLIDYSCRVFLRPLILSGASFSELDALPAYDDNSGVYGLVTLKDGRALIIWNGQAYEVDPSAPEGKPKAVWPLNCQPSFTFWTSAPAADDGFFYISKRQLFEYHVGASGPIAHLPQVKNIMSIGEGPDDSILIKQGDNESNDIGLLYFPKTGRSIHLTNKLFGVPDTEVQCLFWSRTQNKIFALSYNKLYAVHQKPII